LEDAAKRIESWKRIEEDAKALELRGDYYSDSGKPADAERDWLKALEGPNPNPRAALKLARVMWARGETAKAVELLERWRPQLAGDRGFHHVIAALYKKQGQDEKAAEDVRRATAKP
jgi:tetratricopeptide (TPR) repeat protein